MKRAVTVFGVGVLAFLSLGCLCLGDGSGSGGGLGLPGVGGASERAVALCDHLNTVNASKSNPGVSCQPMAVGSIPEVNGVTLKVLSFKKVKGLFTLPEIKNMNERAEFKRNDGHAVAIEVEYTNNNPVKSKLEPRMALQNGAGDRLYNAPYNSKRLLEEAGEGYVYLWDRPMLGPGQSTRTILVITMPEGDEAGSVLEVYAKEKRVDENDPRGRKREFFTYSAILDLPELQELEPG